MCMSQRFFTDLPGFENFQDACASKHYYSAPDDWFVVLTDVRGSTEAIESGRYKDVNMVGAACISASVNVCAGIDIPYVFGGDGATLLIPASCVNDVKKELLAVSHLAEKFHDLSLRVGVIPVSEITKRHKTFSVAKYIMPTGACIAMFGGGGAVLADEILKNEPDFLIDRDEEVSPPNLEGLSCRWKPIPSRKGIMLSLLVMSLSGESQDDIYNDINVFINKALDEDDSPVHHDNIAYKWPTLSTLKQAQMVWCQRNVIENIARHVFEICLFNIMNKFGLALPGLNVPAYKEDMIVNSDYRKFDDMLRMVVDCSQEQASKIELYLEKKYRAGEVVYGIHRSDTALMTCFVSSLDKDGHVHFIDGNDGGYAYAAKEMKSRLPSNMLSM